MKNTNLSIPISVIPMDTRGRCIFTPNENPIKIKQFILQAQDPRRSEYHIKTVFHEFYHASSNNLNHDFNLIGFQNWSKVDDIAAECTAHYMLKKAGVDYEVMPSYSDYLTVNLPKLKLLDDFKSCNTIFDFGEKFFKYRFIDECKTAEWSNLFNHCNNTPINLTSYAKHYEFYVKNNKEKILDKIYENTNLIPEQAIRNYLDRSLIRSWDIYDTNDMTFTDSLILAMNKEGIEDATRL